MFLVAAAAVAPAGGADAHICPVTAVIPVEQLSTVTVAVTVEATPIPDVEMQVPPELRVDRVDAGVGWEIAQQGQTIRYHGPAIPAYACKYFSLGLTAVSKGKFGIPVIQRDAHGKVVARSNADGGIEQIVYAGVKPSSSKSGPSIATILGAALIGLGILLAGVLAFRSWRARRADAREVEMQDRVEEFKKQAQDRSRGTPS